MIFEVNDEIRKLNEKKQNLLKDYDKRIKDLEDRLERLNLAKYFNIDDSFWIISYLVSQMEGEVYKNGKEEIILYAPAYYYGGVSLPFPVSYKISYLVQENEKDIAHQEIKNRFQLKKKQGVVLEKSAYYAIEKQLGIPSEHYIQLACFRGSAKTINYQGKNNISVSENDYSTNIKSYICDERYHYIIDFMNEVINYRLEKEDLEVSLDEMMQLADAFIVKYKSNKNVKTLTNPNSGNS